MTKERVPTVKFYRATGADVFEPEDQPGNYFVPRRLQLGDEMAALRVKKDGREWVPFECLPDHGVRPPLRAELTFFLRHEPGRIVGKIARRSLA